MHGHMRAKLIGTSQEPCRCKSRVMGQGITRGFMGRSGMARLSETDGFTGL